jgi:hypothetical protein
MLSYQRKFFIVNIKECRDADKLSDSSVIVAIIEELIESITAFLCLSNEEIVMLDGL